MSLPGADTDFYKESTASISSDLDVETGYLVYTPTANLNLSGKIVWWWFMSLTASFLDTWENGGFGLKLVDGSGNWSEWYVGGSDTYVGGWRRFGVYTGSTPDYISGTLNLTDVDQIQFRFKATIKSKLADNTFIDYVQYGSTTEGMKVTGGSLGNEEDFAALITADDSVYAGMIRESDGVFYVNGYIEFGDASSGNIYFEDSNVSLRTENKYRTFTTSNRGSAESLVSSEHFKFVIQGNGAGTSNWQVGTKSGGRGVQGGSYTKGGNRGLYVTATDTDVDLFKIYGFVMNGNGVISLPATSANREVMDCQFISGLEVKLSTCKVQYCTVIESTGVGFEIGSTSHNMSDCTFINCVHAIKYTVTGVFALSNCSFVGGDGSTYYDIENPNNATTTDSYSESNQDTDEQIGNGTITAAGQSFTGDGNVLSRARLWLKKVGTLTGTAVCKIYAATGSDPNQTPTGSVLATSETVVANDIGTAYEAVDFEFEDEFTLVNATEYFVVLEYNLDSSNYLVWGSDRSSPPAGSNYATYTGSWSAVSAADACFYIYTGGIVKLTLSNGSDPVYDDNTGTPPGATIMPISVNLTITVKRKDTKVAIQYAEVSVHQLDDGTELMNEQTDVSGIAMESFVYPGSTVDIYWRVREIPGTDPQFKPESSEDQITIDGFTRTVYLENAPYVDDTSS